jgi:hypothetical protein
MDREKGTFRAERQVPSLTLRVDMGAASGLPFRFDGMWGSWLAAVFGRRTIYCAGGFFSKQLLTLVLGACRRIRRENGISYPSEGAWFWVIFCAFLGVIRWFLGVECEIKRFLRAF